MSCESIKFLSGFYDLAGNKFALPVKEGSPAEETAEIMNALECKIDKVEEATADNFLALKADGSIKDSGKRASDFADAAATSTSLANKQDKLTSFTAGNFVKVKSDGTLEDSGKNASDFMPATPIDTTPTANSDNLVTSGGIKTALNGKAAINHSHNVSDITGMDKIQDGDNLIEISGDDTNGEINIKLMSEGDEGEGEDQDFSINADDLYNILYPDDSPRQSSSKLITSGAVFSALSALSSELGGKLDAVPELEVHFDVSGGALVKVSDETEYDDVLSEAVAGVYKWVPIFIGIYDSNEDAYTKFMGTARIGGLTDNITHQLYEIDVDIYVGSYTIHLVKTVSTSTITVSTDRLTSLLS